MHFLSLYICIYQIAAVYFSPHSGFKQGAMVMQIPSEGICIWVAVWVLLPPGCCCKSAPNLHDQAWTKPGYYCHLHEGLHSPPVLIPGKCLIMWKRRYQMMKEKMEEGAAQQQQQIWAASLDQHVLKSRPSPLFQTLYVSCQKISLLVRIVLLFLSLSSETWAAGDLTVHNCCWCLCCGR